jgi:hypothetical protein
MAGLHSAGALSRMGPRIKRLVLPVAVVLLLLLALLGRDVQAMRGTTTVATGVCSGVYCAYPDSMAGKCEDVSGYCSLASQSECDTAASAVSLADTTSDVISTNTKVKACSLSARSELKFNSDTTSTKAASGGMKVVCKACSTSVTTASDPRRTTTRATTRAATTRRATTTEPFTTTRAVRRTTTGRGDPATDCSSGYCAVGGQAGLCENVDGMCTVETTADCEAGAAALRLTDTKADEISSSAYY